MLVVKVGGSLSGCAKEVMEELGGREVLIIPGGGSFADRVREVYEEYGLSEGAAHRMAILAMDQYGLFLSDVSGIDVTESPSEGSGARILLPSRFTLENDPFEPGWEVTSDTVACHIAHLLGEKEFAVLTDVDGLYMGDELVREIHAADLIGKDETCVDRALPKYLLRYKMNCWVANGTRLDGMAGLFEGEFSGTIITGGK